MKPANISRQRIMAEVKKLSNEKLSYLMAAPLAENIYNWHFTIQGPENTEFHEGLYHGQILLPYEYPFKPPDIVFMNKNGRFETNTKICLTITQYHPEEWNSAWTIRTMLEAVISLFAENVQGVGSLASSPDVRQFLAKNSHSYTCEQCGPIKQLLTPRLPRQTENKRPNQSSDVNEIKEELQKSQENSQPAHTQQKLDLKQQLPFYAKLLQKNEKYAKMQREALKDSNRKQKNNLAQDVKWKLIQKQYNKVERPGDWQEVQRIEIEQRGWQANAIGWMAHAKEIGKNLKKLDSVYKSIKWVD